MSEGRRVALVTGSGRNLGRAIAIALAEDGMSVVVNARSAYADADEVSSIIRGRGGEAGVAMGDVGTEVGANAVVDAALESFGRIDVLVNAVGISPQIPVLELTMEDWRIAHAVNVDSLFMLSQRVLPQMIERGWGRILAITGHAHLRGDRERSQVASSKAAAVGFVHSLAREVAPLGITVNAVAPGSHNTSERRPYYRDLAERDTKAAHMPLIPMGRMGEPEEFAAVCAFLCSQKASYVSGQSVLVNGGMYLS